MIKERRRLKSFVFITKLQISLFLFPSAPFVPNKSNWWYETNGLSQLNSVYSENTVSIALK